MITERVDLSEALETLHALALNSGDLGYRYWWQISQLLQQADGMQAELESLRQELARCRANKRSHIRRKPKLF